MNKEQIRERTEKFEKTLQSFVGREVSDTTRLKVKKEVCDYLQEMEEQGLFISPVDYDKIDCRYVGVVTNGTLRLTQYAGDLFEEMIKKIDLHSDENVI